jgi:hypothetical protein
MSMTLDAEFFQSLGINNDGAMRSGPSRVGKNMGFYAGDGTKVGWGDLSADDIHALRDKLPADRPLYLLGEPDNRQHEAGSNPGLDYVQVKARFVILNGETYVLDPELRARVVDGVWERGGVKFKPLAPEQLKSLLKGTGAHPV